MDDVETGPEAVVEQVEQEVPVVEGVPAEGAKAKRVMSEATKQKLRAAALRRSKKVKKQKVTDPGGPVPSVAVQSDLTLEQKVAALLLRYGRDAVLAALDKLLVKLAELGQ